MCVGGAPQLFIYRLSQDWTLVRDNSISAGQSGWHFLPAMQAVVGPTARHSCSWSVSASHSLSGESLASSSFVTFFLFCFGFFFFLHPSGSNARLCKILSGGGHSRRAWKWFEVEALSELDTHPPSISLRFLVFFFFLVWMVTPALLSNRYFNSLCFVGSFAKEFWNVFVFFFLFFFFFFFLSRINTRGGLLIFLYRSIRADIR